MLDALRGYFAHRGVEPNWEAIKRMADDALVVTLAMVCPFEPIEKQALLEAPRRSRPRRHAARAAAHGRCRAGGTPSGHSVS